MGKYSKAIGSIVGGFIGLGFVAIGWTDDLGNVAPMFQPVMDSIVTMVMGGIGAALAPKNAE